MSGVCSLTPTDSEDLRAAWEATLNAALKPAGESASLRAPLDSIPEQYLILVTCKDEKEQIDLLTRFKADGLDCKALLT